MSVTPDFKARLGQITKRNKTWKNAKRTYLPGTPYPEEAWLDAVTQFLILGNMRLVAASTGISYDVLRKWRSTPKWKEIEQELRTAQNVELDNNMTQIVEKALVATLDRIENGDFIWDQKNSQLTRRPAQLKDLHKVAGDLLAKREMIRDSATKRNETPQASTEDMLKALAKEFAKFSGKQEKEVIDLVEVEDTEYRDIPVDSTLEERTNHAVYEERETGLQEGAGVGTQPATESSSRPSGEEQSPTGIDEEGRGLEG